MAKGAERKILKFIVSRSPKMAFSVSSVPLLLGLYCL